MSDQPWTQAHVCLRSWQCAWTWHLSAFNGSCRLWPKTCFELSMGQWPVVSHSIGPWRHLKLGDFTENGKCASLQWAIYHWRNVMRRGRMTWRLQVACHPSVNCHFCVPGLVNTLRTGKSPCFIDNLTIGHSYHGEFCPGICSSWDFVSYGLHPIQCRQCPPWALSLWHGGTVPHSHVNLNVVLFYEPKYGTPNWKSY